MHASVSDMIADLTHNALEADATEVRLAIVTTPETIRVTISDNGKGMDAATLAKAMDPFYSEQGKHAGRRVGLGLPLLTQTVEAVNGSVKVESEPHRGTRVAFSLDAQHLDTPPMGDLAGTLLTLLNFSGKCELIVTRSTPEASYTIARSELVEVLGGLEDAGSLILAREFLESQEESLTK